MDKNPESLRASPSDHSPGSEEALCDFLLLLRADDSSGSRRPLSEYLRRFPELELEVAREYLRRVEGTAPRVPLAGSETRPRYDPGPVIGRGGMGEVRRVHDRELDRELAMKTLRRSGPRARQRFLREAGITGRLDHPGVVPVHELGTDADGQPFFTMKHVEGVDLDEVFRRVRRQDPEWSLVRALEVLIKVCDTVAFAHARGIVHRDLKPSNVRVGRFGEVYVMDWGLARVLGEAPSEACDEEAPASSGNGTAVLTLDGDVLGTPAYMAPEQAEGRNAAVGKTADVYALGAMLYQLLSGERPYASDGEPRGSREVLEHVRTRPPEPLRGKAAGAPIELVAIAEKAMQREPGQRYPDMDAMARDLRDSWTGGWSRPTARDPSSASSSGRAATAPSSFRPCSSPSRGPSVHGSPIVNGSRTVGASCNCRAASSSPPSTRYGRRSRRTNARCRSGWRRPSTCSRAVPPTRPRSKR